MVSGDFHTKRSQYCHRFCSFLKNGAMLISHFLTNVYFCSVICLIREWSRGKSGVPDGSPRGHRRPFPHTNGPTHAHGRSRSTLGTLGTLGTRPACPGASVGSSCVSALVTNACVGVRVGGGARWFVSSLWCVVMTCLYARAAFSVCVPVSPRLPVIHCLSAGPVLSLYWF